MSLELTLENAINGMQASKTSLQIISNNISNVNTEGYTRKIAEQNSRVVDGKGYGVEIGTISRKVDQGLLKQMRIEKGTLERLVVRDDYLSQLNHYFGSPADDNSITHKIGELGGQFNNLAISPEISANHYLAVQAAQDTILALKRMSDEVQHLRSTASTKLKETVTTVNSMLDKIVETNTEIVRFIAQKLPTAELEDQRDKAVTKLAEYMDIDYFDNGDGSITVYAGAGTTLVDRKANQLTYVPPSTMNAVLEYTPTNAVNYTGPTNTGYPIGGIPGIFVGEIQANTDITSGISNGLMKGLIDIRDTELTAIQAQLDELSEKLKVQINTAHNKGAGFPPPNSLTGKNFITSATDLSRASGLVVISVVDKSGNKVETEYINLSEASITNAATLLTNGSNTGINDKFSNLNASINSEGNLVLSATSDNRVAINEMTSSITGAGKIGVGFSDYFGMNDLFTSIESFAAYRTDYKVSASDAAITTGGTLQFTDGTNTSTVNYLANDSLSTLATKISAATGITASVISDGSGFRLQLTHDNANNFSIAETATGTFFANTGLRTDYRGLSGKLKVREDIVSNNSYLSRGTLQSNSFSSGTQSSATSNFATLGVSAGSLSFTIDASTSATISYGNADTLTTVATAINGNATLSAANITAEIVNSGSNVQLKISDSKSDDFWIIDSGGLSTATAQGISIGDGTAMANIAAQFENDITFLAAPGQGGGLAQTTNTFTNYASSILSTSSAQISAVGRDLNFQEQLYNELYSKHTSMSGVNMDEELANMVIIEQSYLAAARIITTTNELFKVLTNMVD